MDWILDHLQILIGAAAAVAYWLNQRREAKPVTDQEPPGKALHEGPSEQDKPSALIPEDLRRRILEQLGIPQPEIDPVVPPTPETLPPPLPVFAPHLPAVLAKAMPAVPPAMRRLKLAQTSSNISVRRKGLQRALQSTKKISEAILLREILGPPVGLQPADRCRIH
jgi:hypothetical protein